MIVVTTYIFRFYFYTFGRDWCILDLLVGDEIGFTHGPRYHARYGIASPSSCQVRIHNLIVGSYNHDNNDFMNEQDPTPQETRCRRG